MNPRLTAADHQALVADAKPSVVLCTDDLVSRFHGLAAVVAGEALAADIGACPPLRAADVAPEDPAYLQYTSGTTGAPKAAVHAHGHPPVYADAFAGPAIALDRRDVVLSVSKLYFAYGLGNALFFPLLTGCQAVLHADHPRPDAVAELVRRHRVTVLFAVPTFFAHLAAAVDAGDLPSLRVAVSAGEPLTVALATRARAVLGCPILDGLGSTEVGQTFASNTLACSRDGTVGHALPPYRVSVRGDDGAPLDAGEVGALWVAGPTLPLGHTGEWLPTGDRAMLDADGFLHLRGRADDIELVGGVCVAPTEIEGVLARHPGVTEVAVAAVVDTAGASRLQAYVVPARRSAPRDEEDVLADLAGQLVALARTELAPFKVPQSVTFVADLPRTPTGKLRRFVLRSGSWPPAQPASEPNSPR